MSEDSLAQRRNWFRFFPEGSIEFVIVTRVLALLLLLALAIVRGTQRPAVLLALVVVLWIDYLLTLWWAVQLATDLNALFGDTPPPADVLRRRRIRAAVLAALPATAALLILAPWPHFVLSEASRTAVTRVTVPALCGLFVVSMFVAHGALRRIELGPPPWTLLLLIPVVHWLAVHRLLISFGAELRQRLQAPGRPATGAPGPGPAVRLADVTWVVTMVSWGIALIFILRGGQWPRTLPGSVLPIGATVMAALFWVADVAAMENVQRQFVALIRKQ